MPLREEFVRSGSWLFRWRSYLPLIVLALVLARVPEFKYIAGRRDGAPMWEAFCFGVSLLGFAVRIVTVGYAARGTSGGNVCAQVAERLNTTGTYSLVRHPLYMGNFLMWLGAVMFLHSGWLVLVVTLCFALYYERIMFAEEEFLREKFGVEFLTWAQRTPAFLPAFRR